MRKILALLLALFVGLGTITAAVAATASKPVTYAGDTTTSYFGDGNLPPGCIRDMSLDNPENTCFHMRTGLNALDSPMIDVLVLVPASPTAERDLRLMRQSIEMWAGGIDQLAKRMGMEWLRDVEFHITADILRGEFTTYPIIDPEIVVIASNPVGGIGIGIDPFQFIGDLGIYDAQGLPCTNIENPFDIAAWEALPGYDSHHDGRSGTYIEDCGGTGGNVCFAVNGAIDPVPGMTEVFSLFDLVSHEVGHCLTVGHVGDGAEGSWGAVPTNDIMSYNEDPVAMTKCVSSLDVEGFALRMSGYLDRNGDGKVDAKDQLDANDLPGDGSNPFQVQSPSDHIYASSTGRVEDCPQPYYGLIPGEEVEWGPTPIPTTRPVLDLKGLTRKNGRVRVAGTVAHAPKGKQPTKTTGSFTDETGDSLSPFNDIEALDVKVTRTAIEATMKVGTLWPTTAEAASSYSLIVNGRRFDSVATGGAVSTVDNGAETYVDGFSAWDTAAGTVTYRIPRAYLAKAGNVAPYYVSGMTSVQNARRVVFNDDFAPEGQQRIAVTGKPLPKTPVKTVPVRKGAKPYTVTFTSDDDNAFGATESNAGLGSLVSDPDLYSMSVTSPSKVEISLAWDDPTSDLDVSAQVGAGDVVYGESGPPDTVTFANARGPIGIEVDPSFVGPTGATYTLTAKVTPIGKDSDGDGLTDPGDQCPGQRGPLPSGCPDRDGDGVADKFDDCPTVHAATANGCPAPATEWIKVFVDGDLEKKVRVDREMGVGRFGLNVDLSRGKHTVRVAWVDRKRTITAVTRRVG